MASRQKLVSRARLNERGTPAQPQRRQRDENAEPTPLPPYEPPTCQLTVGGRRALDELSVKHDYSNYQKHITKSKALIPSAVYETNERLHRRKAKVAKATEKRHQQGKGDEDEDKTELEREDEIVAHQYSKQVKELTMSSEKAMRDLIDFSDEIAMQDTLMKDVSRTIAAAPIPQSPKERSPRKRRRRNEDGGEEEEEEEEEEAGEEDPSEEEEVEALSAAELLKKAREEYSTVYNSKTMLERYGDNNDYKHFKKSVHEALHPGEDGPRLPKASKWFPQDPTNGSSDSPNGRGGRSNNAEEDESDEDVYISGAKEDFKCPISLQPLKTPYTSRVCGHSYEKDVLIGYIRERGTSVVKSSQSRGNRGPEKQIQCCAVGCDKMMKLDDFYDDAEILQKIKRANRQAAYDMEEEDEDEQAPRGTQRGRPEELDDESGDETRKMAKIKKERQSLASRRRARSADVEEMDED